MAHRDSSSLIALSTLRELEADRVRHDHQVRSAAAEAERLAREREQLRVREAYERAAAEEAERAHAEQLARLERDRQDRLRIAEAEARARAEHDARLREEQLRLDVQVRMSEERAKPRWPLAVVPTLVLALLGTGAIVWHGERREVMERESAKRIAMEQSQALAAVNAKLDVLEAEQARLQHERAALEAELAAAAGDEAAQADVLAKIDAVDERIAGNDEARGKPNRPKRPRVDKPDGDASKPVKPRTRPVLEVGNTKDPLGGI